MKQYLNIKDLEGVEDEKLINLVQKYFPQHVIVYNPNFNPSLIEFIDLINLNKSLTVGKMIEIIKDNYDSISIRLTDGYQIVKVTKNNKTEEYRADNLCNALWEVIKKGVLDNG